MFLLAALLCNYGRGKCLIDIGTEGSTLHLKLHLRVLLEDLRVALAEQLRDPFVRNATGAEPRSVCKS